MSRKPLYFIVPMLAFGLLGPVRVAAQDPGPQLTDAEIAHIAVTANAIDVEMGQLARSRATNEEVLNFAATMIADHTAVNEKAAALAERLGVTPANNDVSRSLRTSAGDARQHLRGLNGRAFDRAYMEREVAYHQAVLEALDTTLIPGTDNHELRALLQQARAAIAAHLDHAEQLHDALADGAR